ncbi:MAG: hypothetical protein RI935_264 [Candidatus Parcubacteria bacterium]|jgi:uncharacterized membrane protein YuzA (DUF378 family)
MKSLQTITYVLVIVGALNWGLSALGFNVVSMLLGGMPSVEQLVYLLVGASGVVQLVNYVKANA